MKNNQIIIGNRISQIRQNLNLTREVFSEKIDISTSYLTQLERGERNLSVNTLIKISQLADVNTDYILFGAVNHFNSSILNNILNILIDFSDAKLLMIYELLVIIKKLIKS